MVTEQFKIYIKTCEDIHTQLKERVVGGVVCRYDEEKDVINVNIYNDGFYFLYKVYDATKLVIGEEPVSGRVDAIVAELHKAVNGKYFK